MELKLTRKTMQSELQVLSHEDLLALSDAIDKEMHRRIKTERDQRFNEVLRVPEGESISEKFAKLDG